MNPVRGSLRYPQVTLVSDGDPGCRGTLTLFTMPRREDPKITIRVGLVSAIYPGRDGRRGGEPGDAQDRGADLPLL